MLSQLIIITLFRGIPEAFIHMFGIYAFGRVKLDKKKYMVSSLILAMAMVGIRMLPISYGIHSILVIMTIIAISIIINQFNIVYSITVVIFDMIIQFLAEGINMVLIEYVLKKNISEAMSNVVSKVVYGIPSLVIAFSVIYVISSVFKKRQRNQRNTNG